MLTRLGGMRYEIAESKRPRDVPEPLRAAPSPRPSRGYWRGLLTPLSGEGALGGCMELVSGVVGGVG
jgi:hypothetical protein